MEGGRKGMAPGLLGQGVYIEVKHRLERIGRGTAAAAGTSFTYSRNQEQT